MNERPRPIGQLLRAAQGCDPQDIVATIEATVRDFGGTDAVLYLVDYDHSQLRPYPDVLPHGERPEVAMIEASMAGRSFLSGEAHAAEREEGWHCWVPVTDRAERLGVLALTMPEWDDETKSICIDIGIAASHLVASSMQYTDLLTKLRRRENMTLAAEMQWSLLPPLSFSNNGTSLAGLLEPAYDVGGDCFDYSLNGDILDFAVFDAMGHGLKSAMLATLCVSAYRSARRSMEDADLPTIVSYIDSVIHEQHEGFAFVTALIGQLRITTGELSWVSAGHDAPIHVRQRSSLPRFDIEPTRPLGLNAMFGAGDIHVISETLEPGDSILLFTDGVTEARSDEGEFFGRDRLVDFLEREVISGRDPSEVLRRLVHAVLAHQTERLQDDASMLYLEWNAEIAT